jgi:hypothetical protein
VAWRADRLGRAGFASATARRLAADPAWDLHALIDLAARLLGAWFPDAYADAGRRAWGVAFPSVEERDAYDRGRRLALARLGG